MTGKLSGGRIRTIQLQKKPSFWESGFHSENQNERKCLNAEFVSLASCTDSFYSLKKKTKKQKPKKQKAEDAAQLLVVASCAQRPVPCVLGMMACTCNPTVWETELEGAEVQGHPWLHSEFKATLQDTLSEKHTPNKKPHHDPAISAAASEQEAPPKSLTPLIWRSN